MIDVENSLDIMRPSKGDTVINIPVTFDYSGGRSESRKGRILGSIALGVIGVILGLGIIFAEDGSLLVNLPFGLLTMYGFAIIIRFAIFKEHKVRNRFAEMENEDYKADESTFWGIHAIDDVYPYYCHYKNGSTGLFVMMEKDVILGKAAEAEYDHYEAIGEAYKIFGSMKGCNMYYVDYMDSIGNDERIVENFKSLPEIENPDLQDIMTDVYSYLQDRMSDRVSTFDVYCFTFTGNEANFWYDIQDVIGTLLRANYISFKIMNSDDIRELAKSLFNLHDFSVVEASLSIAKKEKYAGVVPIKLTKIDGSEEVLGKTVEEKKKEQEVKKKEMMLRKEEAKKRKRQKKEEKKKGKYSLNKNQKGNEGQEEEKDLFDILDDDSDK